VAGRRLIALLTDFGTRDIYVGVMKGVIATIAPEALLVDLTHEIAPGNIAGGAFCLGSAVAYLPTDTIYLAVVDPGVGTDRRAVALATGRGLFVGPDNGLCAPLVTAVVHTAVELRERRFWRTAEPSATFHGRDLFAPVAAHLASGVPLAALGPAFDPATLVPLTAPGYTLTPTGIDGSIRAIDRFGNLVTTIPAAAVAGRPWRLRVGGQLIPAGRTYGDRPPGEAVTLIGSHGFVELSINGGDAAAHFRLAQGDTVTLLWVGEPSGELFALPPGWV
jgi:hypothetical protein